MYDLDTKDINQCKKPKMCAYYDILSVFMDAWCFSSKNIFDKNTKLKMSQVVIVSLGEALCVTREWIF